ncbi:MAG: hypothetical protein IPM57_03230 [Oligoflexia bacterium]|nr:hypothetical protein [Oligoflexia bacterium]
MYRKIKFYTLYTFLFVGSCTAVKQNIFNSQNSFATKERMPSSIQRVYDYSDLQGKSLLLAVRERLLKSTEIKYAGNYAMIQVGHFTLLDTQTKNKVFACEYFDTITFEFEGQSVIVDGEHKPQFAVETQCQIAANINYMMPLKIPLGMLKTTSPGKIERKVFDQNQSLTLRTDYIPTEWPKNWILKSIKLTHSHANGRTLVVPILDQQITMRW